MRFFLDNNLAPKLARGLNAFVSPDHEVVHLKQLFPANTEDSVWMGGLAKEENLIIITGDVRIGKNPHEIKAWKEAGHTIFFLKSGWTEMPFWVQVTKFTKCFPEIIVIAMKAKRGSAFIVSVNGKIA